ncbi:hypothetical protein NA57DRAFT_74882 [Rhizodiscina lignyota]|uniref:Uncharacterized protein n=1 Tax=Rhizodiscina lignyota TaxID=1504668 RepID=A0A9P4ICK2_9PEZI|nr:hypothetical protein NA57DRAFT_74882 [Rhizodiscina lignyota]
MLKYATVNYTFVGAPKRQYTPRIPKKILEDEKHHVDALLKQHPRSPVKFAADGRRLHNIYRTKRQCKYLLEKSRNVGNVESCKEAPPSYPNTSESSSSSLQHEFDAIKAPSLQTELQWEYVDPNERSIQIGPCLPRGLADLLFARLYDETLQSKLKGGTETAEMWTTRVSEREENVSMATLDSVCCSEIAGSVLVRPSLGQVSSIQECFTATTNPMSLILTSSSIKNIGSRETLVTSGNTCRPSPAPDNSLATRSSLARPNALSSSEFDKRMKEPSGKALQGACSKANENERRWLCHECGDVWNYDGVPSCPWCNHEACEFCWGWLEQCVDHSEWGALTVTATISPPHQISLGSPSEFLGT